MNYQDLHKAPSQSSEQGAPQLLPCPRGHREVAFDDGKVQCKVCWFTAPLATWQASRTRSDICAALVEALKVVTAAARTATHYMYPDDKKQTAAIVAINEAVKLSDAALAQVTKEGVK